MFAVFTDLVRIGVFADSAVAADYALRAYSLGARLVSVFDGSSEVLVLRAYRG
jgi:hypothetical protein